MQGTSSRFIYYRATELVLSVAGTGLAAYGMFANRDVFKGVGVGMASLSLPLLVIDSFNNTRAERYLHSVERFNMGVGASTQGIQLSTSGRF